MKVCKKCKKKVANKSKICRYCGADVTKCRIIKQEDNKKTVVHEEKKIEKVETLKDKADVSVNKKQVLDKSKGKKDKKIKTNFSIKEYIKDHKKKNRTLEKKVKTKKEVRSLKIKKIIRIVIFVLVLVLFVFLVVFGIRKIFGFSDVIVVKEGTYNNVFKQGDKIKYKDVIYQVSDVLTSMGTEYKKPKEGNEYVVVIIEFENDFDDKVRYSYKDWKMVNSLGEEKSRIFTPINVSSALYTGNLVIGGKKTGSIVFEEPIGDEELMLNYYEYQEENVNVDDNDVKEEKIDEEAEEEKVQPVFSIEIEIDRDDANQA